MVVFVLRIILLLLCTSLMSACSPFSLKKPPVLLILVESFSEKDFLCSDSRFVESFEALSQECEKFVRFTHTFAPSRMTQASISSLVTGQNIQEHKVTHNGALGISAHLNTLAEVALKSGMRTAFFSGGIPLVPKFGIRQGYEIFNDSFDQKKKTFYRSFKKTIAQSMKWVNEEVGRSPFLLTLYVPDLLHKGIATQDNAGEERPLNRSSQIQELYESFDGLITSLKKSKQWNNTHIIILGLNGEASGVIPPNPLNAQMLHVPLQIKLAQSTNTNLQSLTTEMVSFSLLGRWLQQIVSHKPSQGVLKFVKLPDNQFIPQVSHWKSWLGLANWVDLGLRKKQYLLGFTPQLKVFDTFHDKKEQEPLSSKQANPLLNQWQVNQTLRKNFVKECYDTSFLKEGWVPSHKNCTKPKFNEESMRGLSLISQWSDLTLSSDEATQRFNALTIDSNLVSDPIAWDWLAYHSLYRKKWTRLFDLGKRAGDKAMMLVAQANLHETPSFEGLSCLKYFVGENHRVTDFYKYCQDSHLKKVVEGIRQLKNKKRPSNSFWSQVDEIKKKREAKNINLNMKFINDVREPFKFRPNLAELYFFLPENSDYLSLIKANET